MLQLSQEHGQRGVSPVEKPHSMRLSSVVLKTNMELPRTRELAPINASSTNWVVSLVVLLNVAFLGEPALAGWCPKPDFQTPRIIKAGQSPRSLTIAYFDADNHLDLAVIDGASNSIVLVSGYGDGTFQISDAYGVGVGPVSLAAGDLNGDGRIDLVTANQGAYDPNSLQFTNSSVSILIGAGNGTFQPAMNYTAGTQPKSIAVCDLNGDGQSDLAVGNWGSSDVSILLGNGDGTFLNAVSYPAGENAAALVTSDFNGDGWTDVAAAGEFFISVLLGNGDGTLKLPVTHIAGSRHSSLVASDFNSDGHADLIVDDYDTRFISVLLSTGTGTFRTAVPYEVLASTGLLSLAVSDLNGDGATDLAIADYAGVSILLGKGDGTFGAAATFGPPAGTGAVAVADFNHDGKADLATVSLIPRTVWIQFGDGNGSFESTPAYRLGSTSFPTCLAAGDFDSDGNVDLVVGSAGTTAFISLLLGRTEVGFRAPLEYSVGSGPKSVAVGDFNSDGKLDIVTANSESTNMSVLLGQGDGTFSNAVSYTTGLLPISVTTADFDRDGHADIAVVDDLAPGDFSVLFGVRVFKGIGDGRFEPGTTYSAGTNAQSLAAGDFDGDGYPDLAVANFSIPSAVTVLLGKGDGTFADGVSYDAAGSGALLVVPGDVNGDSKLDLTVLNSIVNSFTNFSTVSVLLGKGDGTFGVSITGGTQPYARTLSLGDFNGDGRPDLAAAGWQEQNPIGPDLYPVSVQLGNGDGTFQAPLLFAAGAKPQFLVARDLNRDGQVDLAVASVGPGSDPDRIGPAVSVLINVCSSSEVGLSITLDALSVNISWPFPSTGFALESTTGLSLTNWQRATEAPTTNNSRLEASIPLDQQQRYFRLRKP